MDNNLATLSDSFMSVTDLAMAKMNYTWFDVRRCIRMFPAIKNLSVSFNAIEDLEISSKDSNFMKLTDLTLEENLIRDWGEVLKLGCLPWLENAILLMLYVVI